MVKSTKTIKNIGQNDIKGYVNQLLKHTIIQNSLRDTLDQNN